MTKNQSQWVLLVQTSDGNVRAERFENAEAAEAAAYIVKIAKRTATVSIHCDPLFWPALGA